MYSVLQYLCNQSVNSADFVPIIICDVNVITGLNNREGCMNSCVVCLKASCLNIVIDCRCFVALGGRAELLHFCFISKLFEPSYNLLTYFQLCPDSKGKTK